MEPRAAVKQSAELLKSANSDDHFISMKECFDADTLDAIIKNKDVCKKQRKDLQGLVAYKIKKQKIPDPISRIRHKLDKIR